MNKCSCTCTTLLWGTRLILFQTLKTKVDLVQVTMIEFPVPPELHESFQTWVCQNNLARFDCFLDPSTECDCYKCKTILAKMEAAITYFEARKDSIEKRAIRDMEVVVPFQP